MLCTVVLRRRSARSSENELKCRELYRVFVFKMINMMVPLIFLIINAATSVHAAKQQVQLSDSYLPVAMQIIAHLTDQMAFEVDDVTPSSISTTTTTKPPELTTRPHKPGFYAPSSPPSVTDRFNHYWQRFILLPLEQATQYTVIRPQEPKTEASLLSIHQEQVQPLVEPRPQHQNLLPPYEVKISSRSDGFVIDEDLTDDSLQYLTDDVKELIKIARNPGDDRVVDVWDGFRSGPEPISARAKLSSSNLRLLLLYDLLSRDAKRQRLSDFSGFSPEVMKALVESSNGGARAQLKMALSKMVERGDCGHEYANNRAKEMVTELEKDESKLSSELRYLQPLVYKY
ncbi:uncharacterized protein LOC100862793 isoform X2 [Bombyx mori]|uniref:Uncharacterized protein n=1 Tax=Bombyx mori TaxID=7091 RepID=A0A8R2C777_BOMMO|nr:uncharacterized protein LOC100862793 isoform X1 [Bombyx mori]